MKIAITWKDTGKNERKKVKRLFVLALWYYSHYSNMAKRVAKETKC